jgi:type II secretory pathway pseudopilin PulG
MHSKELHLRGEEITSFLLRKSFTLSEVLISLLIIVMVLVAGVSSYCASARMMTDATAMTTAIEDANSIMEVLQSMDMNEIRDDRSDTDFWSSFLTGTIENETVTLENCDPGDTNWNNDPLELMVTVSWGPATLRRNVQLTSLFSDE